MGKYPEGPVAGGELPDWVQLLVNAQTAPLRNPDGGGWSWDETTNTLTIVDVSGAGGWVWGVDHPRAPEPPLDIPASNFLIIASSGIPPGTDDLAGTLSNRATIDVQGTIYVQSKTTLSNDANAGMYEAGVINIQKGGNVVVAGGDVAADEPGGTISNMFSSAEYSGQINIMLGGSLTNLSGPNPWPPEKTIEWLRRQTGIQNRGGTIDNSGTIINQGLFLNDRGSVANGFWPPRNMGPLPSGAPPSSAIFVNQGRFVNLGYQGGTPLAAGRNLLTNTGTITNVGNGGGGDGSGQASGGVINFSGSIVQNAGLIDNSGNITNRFILHNMTWPGAATGALPWRGSGTIYNQGIIYCPSNGGGRVGYAACSTSLAWVGAIVNDEGAWIINMESPAYPDPVDRIQHGGVIAIQGPLLDGAYWLEQWKDGSGCYSQFYNKGDVENRGQILMVQSPTSPPLAPQDPSMNQFRNFVVPLPVTWMSTTSNYGHISCSPLFCAHNDVLSRMPTGRFHAGRPTAAATCRPAAAIWPVHGGGRRPTPQRAGRTPPFAARQERLRVRNVPVITL